MVIAQLYWPLLHTGSQLSLMATVPCGQTTLIVNCALKTDSSCGICALQTDSSCGCQLFGKFSPISSHLLWRLLYKACAFYKALNNFSICIPYTNLHLLLNHKNNKIAFIFKDQLHFYACIYHKTHKKTHLLIKNTLQYFKKMTDCCFLQRSNSMKKQLQKGKPINM